MNGTKFKVELNNYLAHIEFIFDDFIKASNFMETALETGGECFKASITIVREEKKNEQSESV